jgi:DNA-binding NtrC family response regulator
MQTPREISENRAMHGIAVALLTEDRNRLSELQRRLEATRLAQVVFSNVGFPIGPTDSILRQIQDLRAEVVIVDISPDNPQPAIRVIELIQSNTLQLAIFANGTMQQPTTIVASMRAGAGEYLDESASSEALLEALTRFSSNRTRTRGPHLHVPRGQGRRRRHHRSGQHGGCLAASLRECRSSGFRAGGACPTSSQPASQLRSTGRN